MSTFYRAGREWQGNVWQGNQTARVCGFHSLDNHSSDEFSGRSNLSSFLKNRVKGGRKISDNRKFSGKTARFQKIFGLFFWSRTCRVSQIRSSLPSFMSLQVVEFPVKPVKPMPQVKLLAKSYAEYFKMNGLQNKQLAGRSNSVKLNQTSCEVRQQQRPVAALARLSKG